MKGLVGNMKFTHDIQHIIALLLLALIPYHLTLADGDGGFMTPSNRVTRHVAPGLSSLEMKHKSRKAIEICDQGLGRPQHYVNKHKLSSIYPDASMLGDVGCSLSPSSCTNRRQILQSASIILQSLIISPLNAHAAVGQQQTTPFPRGNVFQIEDPNTFSAVVYISPVKRSYINNDDDGGGKLPQTMEKKVEQQTSYPLVVVLHGAGNNKNSALNEFTQAGGDHTNLPLYLLSTNQAPSSLSENFVVVAPYVGKGKRSLYDEPRGKVLSFVKWFNSWIESQTLEESSSDGTTNSSNIAIDRRRISLFGFSEGSALAVELATTRQFSGVVVCSYGYTGILPRIAVQRLQGIPIWVFHSKGDDVYDIRCSNQLVESLISYEAEGGGSGLDVFSVGNIVKFTKLIPLQQERRGGEVGLEHVRAALVASKSDELFSWLLSL